MRGGESGCCAGTKRTRRTFDQEKSRTRKKDVAMAINLQPKTNYKLVSQDHVDHDKVIVQVKLTDSCLRALQDFKNAKVCSDHSMSWFGMVINPSKCLTSTLLFSTQGPSRNTPLIKFSGQNGVRCCILHLEVQCKTLEF